MITKFKLYELHNDTPEYLFDLKIGDKIIFIDAPSRFLKYGDTYIIDTIVKYNERSGNRYYDNVDKIENGDLISIRNENGYLILDDDGDIKMFFPNKFTTPEIFNIINDTKKFNL